MRAIHFFGGLGVLAFAVNVLAAPQPVKRVQYHADSDPGGLMVPGPVNNTMSPANNCSAPHAAGVLAASGGVLSGDTFDAGNDFEDVWHNCSYSCNYAPYGCDPDNGSSGMDEIWEFTVEGPGRWTFDTCTIPAGWDTSLGLYRDTGMGCPGMPLICNGDDPCGANYESAIRDVCLAGGATYWLVVDGWSPATWFPGTYYDVSYSRTAEPCTLDSECDDGDLCNGIEACEYNCCVPGERYCPLWAECDPGTQTCINVQDPCTAALNGPRGDYTATQDLDDIPYWKCDDIETWEGAGRKLVDYTLWFQAREYWDNEPVSPDFNPPLGTLIPVETAIFTNSTDGSCMPDQIIPGTECTLDGFVTTTGDPTQPMLCEVEPQTVVLPDRSGDFDNCEIDFFLCMRSAYISGFGIGAPPPDGCEEIVGGPAGYGEWSVNVVMYQDYANGTDSYCSAGLDDCTNCTVEGVPDNALCDTVQAPDPPSGDGVCDFVRPAGPIDGCWGASWFGGAHCADMGDAHVCAEPAGACCHADSGCTDDVAPKDCVPPDQHQGTNVLDDFTYCADGDPDDDDYYFGCDNCPEDWNPTQANCDGDAEGDACEDEWANQDDDKDGCCNGVDECPTDPAKCEEGQCGCFEDEIDTDGDCDDPVPPGCEGMCMDCVDLCPLSPIKCAPGICGCDRLDEGDADGDGVLDCVDECPGVNDAIFAPGCQGAIPTVSEWGLVILALLLLVAGKVYFGRRATA